MVDGDLTSNDVATGATVVTLVLFTSFLRRQVRANSDEADANAHDAQGGVVFGAEDWKEISKPDNYVMFNTKVRQKIEESSSSRGKKRNFPKEKKVVAMALLILFAPIFSFELFLALSRQIVCGGTSFAEQSWAIQLCSPHYEL